MNYLENLGKTYTISQGTAVINGKNGINSDKDESIRYGKNAAANYKSYVESYTTKPLDPKDYDLSRLTQLDNDQFEKRLNRTSQAIDEDMSASLTPINFNYKYLPEEKVDPQNINKMALLGAAFEALGKRMSVPVDELTATMQKAGKTDISAETLDINNDKQVDVGEYASSILLQDMLSSDSENIDANNIKGVINNSGMNKSLAYVNKKNINKAVELIKNIYKTFGLVDAYKEFTSKNEKND